MIFFKIPAFFKNISLKRKIFINNLLLCIIPLSVISVTGYNIVVSNTKNTMTDFINLFSAQLSSEIENYVSSFDNLSKMIINDEKILKFLSHEEEYILSDRMENRKTIEKYIYDMTLQKPDVRRIVIVGASKIIYGSESPELPLEIIDLENAAWYRKMQNSGRSLVITPYDNSQDSESPDNSNLTVIGRELKDIFGNIHGIISFQIDLKNTLNTSIGQNNIIDDYNIRIDIRNRTGDRIFGMPDGSNVQKPEGSGGKVLTITNQSKKYGLVISFFIPEQKLFEKIYLLRNIIIVVIAALIVLAVFFSMLISHTISRPLFKLVTSMKSLQQNQYDFITDSAGNNEVGILTRTYNQMLSKINTLINEVYAAKFEERQAQYAALQAQVNPHMLYNTLENIRMRAMLNNDPEVALMIKNLGKIYKLTMAKNKANYSISDEIEYISIYVNLMNIRHINRYKLATDIPEEIMQAEIIRFAFQPVIENSIVHGFRNKLDDCWIRISAFFHEKGILLKLADNGEGIEPETLEKIKQKLSGSPDPFSEAKTGIGLQNVYDRIKLEYGKEYYLTIDSEISAGTTVEMLIPFQKR